MPAAKKVEFAMGNFQSVRIFVLIGVWELSLRMGSRAGGGRGAVRRPYPRSGDKNLDQTDS